MTRSVFQRYARNENGEAISLAEINVIISSGPVADIYADSTGGSPITQPLVADANGYFRFYVEPGLYDVSATDPVLFSVSTFLREEIGTSRESLIDDDQHAKPYSPLNKPDAVDVNYDNSSSGLTATEVQAAINEVNAKTDLINDLSQAYEFATVAEYKAFTTEFPLSKRIYLADRNAYFTVIASGTEDGFNIIKNTTLSQSINLIVGKDIIVSQWIDADADFQAAIPFMDALGKKIIIDRAVSASTATVINSDVEFTPQGTYTTAEVAPDPNVAIYQFNGNVTAPRSEIFLGDGDIVLNGSSRVVYPEWFGIFNFDNGNDGSVNLDSNIRRAGRCNGDSQCAIEFGNGLYYIRDFLIDQSNSGIIGQGKDNTFLKNSIVNNTSTRFGVQVTIFAPTTALPANLGNRNWVGTSTTTDCYIRDLTIVWNDTDTVATDPQMNCFAWLGCQGGEIRNVHASLPTGQRAFAIQTNDQDQETEDVLMTGCSSDGGISGIYLSEGFVTNTGKTFKNIQVINNHFSVRLVASDEPLGPSSSIILHGLEVPANIDVTEVIIRDNHCEGGAKGVHTQSPDVTTKWNSKVILEANSFKDFREQGILSYIEDMDIIRNTFDSTLMETQTIQAGGIVLYTNANGGALTNSLIGNIFKNLSGTGTIYGVSINSNEGCNHLLDDNVFRYDNGLSPAYDVFFLDSTGVLGDVKLSNNTFYDTAAANVRGTTISQEMLYHDLGGNQKMNLFNGEIYDVRLSAPVDSRYYKRGETLKYGLAVFTAGTQTGYICTADHTPLSAGTWKSVIG